MRDGIEVLLWMFCAESCCALSGCSVQSLVVLSLAVLCTWFASCGVVWGCLPHQDSRKVCVREGVSCSCFLLSCGANMSPRVGVGVHG